MDVGKICSTLDTSEQFHWRQTVGERSAVVRVDDKAERVWPELRCNDIRLVVHRMKKLAASAEDNGLNHPLNNTILAMCMSPAEIDALTSRNTAFLERIRIERTVIAPIFLDLNVATLGKFFELKL